MTGLHVSPGPVCTVKHISFLQAFNVFVCVYAFWETPPSVPAPAAQPLP